MSSAKRRPFCLGLNVLIYQIRSIRMRIRNVTYDRNMIQDRILDYFQLDLASEGKLKTHSCLKISGDSLACIIHSKLMAMINSKTYSIVLKIIKDLSIFRIISWILFNRRRPDLKWSKPTCYYLSCTVNTYAMPADALVTERAWVPSQ